jgi:nucleoside-diphosphate-sugar epimerase
MRVLVTGGSGYFGTKFISSTSRESIHIESIDIGYFWNCWFGKNSNINERKLSANNISETLLVNFDAVIHFAGISNDPLKQLTETELHDPSLEYTMKIAKICKSRNIKFIYASSCSVYGKQNQEVSEKSLVNPQTPYSLNKIQIENLLLELSDRHWVPFILRFSTLYGFSPRMRFDTVINMLCGMSIVENKITLNSNGAAARPFIFIDDAIAILKEFLYLSEVDTKLMKDPIVNIGSNENNFTIKKVADLIGKLQNVPVITNQVNSLNELHKDRKHKNGVDTRSYTVNFDKLSQYLPLEFNFTPMEIGISITLNDLISNKIDQKTFYSNKFYRLQFLEEMVDRKLLNNRLEFI